MSANASSDTERVDPTKLASLIYGNFDVSTLEAENIAWNGLDSDWEIHTDTERGGD